RVDRQDERVALPGRSDRPRRIEWHRDAPPVELNGQLELAAGRVSRGDRHRRRAPGAPRRLLRPPGHPAGGPQGGHGDHRARRVPWSSRTPGDRPPVDRLRGPCWSNGEGPDGDPAAVRLSLVPYHGCDAVRAKRRDRRRSDIPPSRLALRARVAVRALLGPRRRLAGVARRVHANRQGVMSTRPATGRQPGAIGRGSNSEANRAETKASGSNGIRSPTFSPTPTNRTGTLRASSIAKTMPPLEVESSLVSAIPVRPTASWNALAWARPFWPVVASMTKRVSGSAAGRRLSMIRRILDSSSMRFTFVW